MLGRVVQQVDDTIGCPTAVVVNLVPDGAEIDDVVVVE